MEQPLPVVAALKRCGSETLLQSRDHRERLLACSILLKNQLIDSAPRALRFGAHAAGDDQGLRPIVL
jgi:hypothetical protein